MPETGCSELNGQYLTVQLSVSLGLDVDILVPAVAHVFDHALLSCSQHAKIACWL